MTPGRLLQVILFGTSSTECHSIPPPQWQLVRGSSTMGCVCSLYPNVGNFGCGAEATRGDIHHRRNQAGNMVVPNLVSWSIASLSACLRRSVCLCVCVCARSTVMPLVVELSLHTYVQKINAYVQKLEHSYPAELEMASVSLIITAVFIPNMDKYMISKLFTHSVTQRTPASNPLAFQISRTDTKAYFFKIPV